MSLYKVGETWYIYITHQGERIRRSAGTADKRQAQKLHDQLKAELWQRRAAGRSWFDAIRLWLDGADRDASDRYRLRALGIGDIPLDRITAQLVEEKLAGKRAANWQRYRNLVLAVLNAARRAGWIDDVPKIAGRKPPDGRIRWLTREEWDRLYRELPPHLQPLALFA
ncbi:MAG: site-specific integrase, partial [Candidatus Desulfobacillus denitrificans]